MSDYSSSNNRIAKNTIFLSVRMIIVLVVNLFTTRNVLQTLGVVDFGVYNVVCGFVAMFSFLNTSMSNGIQRFFNYEFGKNGVKGANNVYNTSIYIQTVLAICVIIIVEIVGLWYLHNKLVIPLDRMNAAGLIFQFSLIMFVVGIIQAPFLAAVTAHEKMNFYAIVSVGDATLKLAISFAIIYSSVDALVLYGLLMALECIIIFFLYYIYCKKNFTEIHFNPVFDKVLFKSMLGFSGWNLFGSFSGVIVDQGINLVLNGFFGPVVNAARGIAVQVNGAVQSFVVNISMPVRPQVTQSYALGDIDRVINLTYSVSKITCAIVLMLAIPMSLEIDYLLYLWLGNNVPEYTTNFAIIVLFTSLITNLNWATSGVVHASGIMRDYQVLGSTLRMCAIPLAYFLLKFYEFPELALMSVLVCQLLAHYAGLYVVKKLVDISLWKYCKNVVMPICIIMILSSLLLYGVHTLFPEGFIRLLLVSATSVVVTVILYYIFGLSSDEKCIFKQYVNKLSKSFN